MAKLTTVIDDTNHESTIRRLHRTQAEDIIADIDSMDTSRLSVWELEFVEKAADAGYIAEGTIHKLEQIREKLERHERGRR